LSRGSGRFIVVEAEEKIGGIRKMEITTRLIKIKGTQVYRDKNWDAYCGCCGCYITSQQLRENAEEMAAMHVKNTEHGVLVGRMVFSQPKD
jgi:hypothetical protein